MVISLFLPPPNGNVVIEADGRPDGKTNSTQNNVIPFSRLNI